MTERLSKALAYRVFMETKKKFATLYHFYKLFCICSAHASSFCLSNNKSLSISFC